MLNALGYTVKEGHIQDGTIIEVPKGRKKQDGTSTRDPEASFTKKNGRSYHGYKGHIETTTKGDFISNTSYTTASVHDSQEQDTLMTGDETKGYSDSAYGMSKNKNDFYEAHGMKTEFHEKGTRNHPLTLEQTFWNRIKSSVRANVEHPFSTIKHRFQYRTVRYR
jgi:transposase, IS5 family